MKTYFWAYFSRASSVASSLIIMPFALTKFSQESFAIWMLFITFYSLIVVFDFGFTVTISRQMNYAISGARSIKKEGLDENKCNKIDAQLFTKLYLSSKYLFKALTLITFILLTISYFFYLEPIAKTSNIDIKLEWTMYSLSILIGIYCLTFNALFFGTHNVKSIYKVNSITNIIFFLIAIPLIYLDFDLLSIALARVISACVYLLQSRYEVGTQKMLAHYVELADYKKQVISTLRTIAPNASKLGGTVLGNFMVTKASVLLVAYYLPLADSGSYALALNVISVIISISMLYMTIITPEINSFRQKSDTKKVIKLQKNIRLVCLGLYFIFALAFVLLGDFLLQSIESITKLPPSNVLLAFFLLGFLDVNRQISMNFIMSKNTVPFVRVTVISGIICTLLTIAAFELGLLILMTPLIIQLIVQSSYNNWYWTYIEMKEFKAYSFRLNSNTKAVMKR